MTTVLGKDLSFSIEKHVIFSGVSLECVPGKMTALTGPSGCGKTTLLNVLGLLAPATSGHVFIGNEDASGWNEKKRRAFWANQAAFIYQDYGIIEDEDLLYNVTLRSRVSSQDKAAVDEVLSHVGLLNRKQEKAAVLSGGEKQRLGIARAIFKNASVIFADEPTASLDSQNSGIVTDLLRSRATSGATVIISTHDTQLVKLCDYSYAMAG